MGQGGLLLVVVERSEDALPVFTKACTLARHNGARIALYLCEAELGHALRHAYDQSGIGSARESVVGDAIAYLEALRRAVDVPELVITVEASCETPLYQGILQRVLMLGPDLVIKAVGSGSAGARPGPSLNDWHLARTCPAPLLFMGPHAWRPTPRIAASIDPTDGETPGFAAQIVDSASRLAQSCRGELDLVYCSPVQSGAPLTATATSALDALRTRFRVPRERIHVLQGDPVATLPRFIAHEGYDVVGLGALTHRQGITELVGTLTEGMIQQSKSDFLLLKPGAYVRTAKPA